VREFGELPREFRRHDLAGRDAAGEHLFEPPQLVGLEALRLAFNVCDG
jgi:hypothetical protein